MEEHAVSKSKHEHVIGKGAELLLQIWVSLYEWGKTIILPSSKQNIREHGMIATIKYSKVEKRHSCWAWLTYETLHTDKIVIVFCH